MVGRDDPHLNKIRTREAGTTYISNIFILSKEKLIKEQAGLTA
jgi:hypothetical protein